jgi:hypothetical protein
MGTIRLIDDAQICDLAPIFGDLSQSEKLSGIKPPLHLWGNTNIISWFRLQSTEATCRAGYLLEGPRFEPWLGMKAVSEKG